MKQSRRKSRGSRRSRRLKKAELKKLLKERDAALNAEAQKKAEANKAAIMAAVEASGKSVDEILEFLK